MPRSPARSPRAYAWGLGSLVRDESGTAQACQDANQALFGQVGAFEVSYLPPALDCRLSGVAPIRRPSPASWRR
ncbi:hypothetical protein SLA_5415 [Streptomyces laurentii]|uniref:Uncharacterized protein n=1 Tax=Streptomyces laurentii TaxID=39478 RepID=A0A160P6E1_STRLU|nr:hypothetical protein SLA_5415 [Streptomyces laurentii]